MDRRGLVLGLGQLLLLGCAAPRAPTPTRAPLARVTRPTPRPTPTPIPSGGIGLFRDEWERLHGPPTTATERFLRYAGGYGAAFLNDIAFYVERDLPSPVDVDEAREESRALMPDDAQLQLMYQTRLLVRIDLYKSESLLARFRDAAENVAAPDPWMSDEPGTFIVILREEEGKVVSLALSTGRNLL